MFDLCHTAVHLIRIKIKIRIRIRIRIKIRMRIRRECVAASPPLDAHGWAWTLARPQRGGIFLFFSGDVLIRRIRISSSVTFSLIRPFGAPSPQGEGLSTGDTQNLLLGPPAKPSAAGSLGRGGARERRKGDQREPEEKRTLRRRGKVDCPKGKTEEEKRGPERRLWWRKGKTP